jgi:hypothetical protein
VSIGWDGDDTGDDKEWFGAELVFIMDARSSIHRRPTCTPNRPRTTKALHDAPRLVVVVTDRKHECSEFVSFRLVQCQRVATHRPPKNVPGGGVEDE